MFAFLQNVETVPFGGGSLWGKNGENMITIKTPFLPYFDGLALFGCIVILKKGHERLLNHELVHIAQQKKEGRFRYHWKWLTDWRFRAKMEIEAYKGDGLSDYAIAQKLKNLYRIDLTDQWNVFD